MYSLQSRIHAWAVKCFGEDVVNNKTERAHRFIEESLELVQAVGVSRAECEQVLDYVYSRPVGDVKQEIGGTIITLSVLCSIFDVALDEQAETELERIWEKIDKIREKQLNKPKFSPLPQ